MTMDACNQEAGVRSSSSSSRPIYYFGYGPIVNPMVRSRRQLNTSEEQPAILPEHRLTFAYGGIVNMVRQRGYEVHGILMKFASEEDWKRYEDYDAGYNDCDLVQVLPYNGDEPISAYAMTMKEHDESKLEAPIEQLPTERYLKLIANGMRYYKVDEDYIEDQIMSVPYVPSRKPEDYEKFPQASEHLPKIAFSKYQRLCQRSKDIYFILNNKVCRLGPHDPEHPGVVWIKTRMHGQHDTTLIVHQTIVEPDLPMVDTLEELTPRHHAWAENHCFEYMRKCNLTATKVYEVVPEASSGKGVSLLFCCFGGRKQSPSMARPTQDPSSRSLNSRRRSTHLMGRISHNETFLSSELMQQEIRMAVGDGGDTDDNSSSHD